uniref:Uncharacterized protein n=1 Tax=Anguilla anguilla TaxID=7936 RepID=A0A0E9R1K9_ANGAN
MAAWLRQRQEICSNKHTQSKAKHGASVFYEHLPVDIIVDSGNKLKCLIFH